MSLKLLRKSPFVAAGSFGFIGGIVAWTVGEPVWYYGSRLLESSAPLRAVVGDAPDLFFAGVLGLYLGFFLGAVEGVLAVSARTFSSGLLAGGVAGLVGGALGTLAGGFAFEALGGSQVGRALGWALFGALLGVAPGMVLKAVDRAARGFLGGAVGGFLGGTVFFAVSRVLDNPVLGRAVSIPLLGAILGACYGLVETLMRKAWITVLCGGAEGYEFPIGSRPVTLGGGSRADVRLVANPPLPGLVARLVPGPNGVVLERLDIDKVLVNNEPTEGTPLKDGDIIKVRTVRVLFSQKEARGPISSATLTPVGAADRAFAPPPKQAAAGPAPSPKTAVPKQATKWMLEKLSSPGEGKRFAIAKDQTTIGRDDGNDIVIDDLSVSLRHAEIVRNGKFWVVFDLSSSNGTFVQGRRVRENALKNGFAVDFGQVKFRWIEE